MDQWISAAKVNKMFGIDSEGLAKMESEGKVRTTLVIGNRKLYALSSFDGLERKDKKSKLNFFNKLVSVFFSWFRHKDR